MQSFLRTQLFITQIPVERSYTLIDFFENTLPENASLFLVFVSCYVYFPVEVKIFCGRPYKIIVSCK